MSPGPHLFLAAGEPSGDALGAALMRALREKTGDSVRFSGVGGPLMEGQGLRSLFPQDELAVMGLVEVLPRLPQLLRRIRETAEACIAAKPDALITIDSPGFGLRVATRLRERAPSIRRVHYVAPSVWAWRPGRAEKLARKVDQLLALLPFEPPYFTRHGLRCDFVGHPLAVRAPASAADQLALRAELGVAQDAPVLLTLPGSRRGEVTRHAPLFGAALRALDRPDLRLILPTVPATESLARALSADWPTPPLILPPGHPGLWAAFSTARAALAASGTVTLELAAARTPMLAVYRVHPLSAFIARRLIRIDTANLVNLVSEARAVPELIQDRFTPDSAARLLSDVLADSAARDAQLSAFDNALIKLGKNGPPPADRAADAVLDGLDWPGQSPRRAAR